LVGSTLKRLPHDAKGAAYFEMQKDTSVKKMSFDTLHQKLGHPGEDRVRTIAKIMGFNLIEPETVCEACANAKARQKNLNQEANQSEVPGERLAIDISSVNTPSLGGTKFWVLITDENTKMKWSFFLKRKNEIQAQVMPFMKELFGTGFKVKFVRMDNAGENEILQRMIKNEYSGIKIERTAPGIPQQNGVVERAFPTLWGHVRSMLNAAKLDARMRTKLWAECARTATKLDNIMVKGSDVSSPFEKFYKEVTPKFRNHLHTFGEVAIVKNHLCQIKSKLEDRGIPCTILGYAEDHAGEVFQFMNMNTEQLIMSSDSKWLDKMYGDYKQGKDLVSFIY